MTTLLNKDFKNINHTILATELDLCDWNTICLSPSVDTQLSILEQYTLNLYDVSVSCTNTKHMAKSWITPQIKKLIADRDRAYCKWKRYKTDYFHNKFRTLRELTSRATINLKK